MTDHEHAEDLARKQRMAQRRNPTVTPTDDLKKLVAVLGKKPRPVNEKKISELEML